MKYTILLVSFFVILLVFFPACQKTSSISPVLQEAETWMESNPDSSLSLLEAIPYPEKLSKEEYATWCLLVTQARDKNYVEHTSDSVINIAVNYFEKQSNSKREAQSYYCQGRVLSDLLESSEALEAYLKALEAVQQTTEYSLKARICNHLGTLYWKNRSKMKGLASYKMAKTAYEECGDTVGIVNALRNIGRSFADIQETDSAMFYLEEALSLAENGEIESQKSYILAHIGSIFSKEGQYKQALAYNLEALSLARKKEMQYPRYYAIGSVYNNLNQLDSALYYTRKALESQDIDVKSSANRLLSLIYGRVGQYEKAFRFNDQYIQLRDSSEHLFMPTELSKVEALYNKTRLENKQYREIQLLENKRKTWLIALLSVCLLALFVYFYLNRRIREQKQSLDQYQRRLKENEQSLSVSRQKIRIKDEEYNTVLKKLFVTQEFLETSKEQIQQQEENGLHIEEAHRSELVKNKSEIISLIENLNRILAEKVDWMSKHDLLLEQQNKLYVTIEGLFQINKKHEKQIAGFKQMQSFAKEEYYKLKQEKEILQQNNEERIQWERKISGQYEVQLQKYEEWENYIVLQNPYLAKLKAVQVFQKFELDDWQKFEINFNQVFPDFRMHLVEIFPKDFRERDIRICSLVKLGLKTSKISCILDLEPDTITKQKKDIYKKYFYKSEKQSLDKALKTWF